MTVTSRIPGRLRIELPKMSPTRTMNLLTWLQTLPGVQKVECNRRTRRLLVLFAPGSEAEKLLSHSTAGHLPGPGGPGHQRQPELPVFSELPERPELPVLPVRQRSLGPQAAGSRSLSRSPVDAKPWSPASRFNPKAVEVMVEVMSHFLPTPFKQLAPLSWRLLAQN